MHKYTSQNFCEDKHCIKWSELPGNKDELKIPPDDFDESSANIWSRLADNIKTCTTASLEITQYARI